jgi:glycosyltransferase involved in cell wall biosynthesis
MNSKLSVVLAVRNEEENIARCLEAIKDIADEIIIFDEYSTDNTTKIAKDYGAKVFEEPHHDNFHITKQKAIDTATGDWILQLDADEVVTPELGKEILEVISLSTEEIKERRPKNKNLWKLFMRHQNVIEQRDGKFNKNSGEVVAFFVPRRNMFLNKPLIHAGVYPDAAIRLIKKGKAYLPAKSVHEQMQINGEISWLFNDLLHYDSPTLDRYLDRANRYTSFTASKFEQEKLGRNFKNLVYYSTIAPVSTFLKLYIRHKGFKDGIRGFLWSALSAWHFPIAYYKYYTEII